MDAHPARKRHGMICILMAMALIDISQLRHPYRQGLQSD